MASRWTAAWARSHSRRTLAWPKTRLEVTGGSVRHAANSSSTVPAFAGSPASRANGTVLAISRRTFTMSHAADAALKDRSPRGRIKTARNGRYT
jgi:hypothetical protein